MTDKKQWIPPRMRACAWDEAQWATADGKHRFGILEARHNPVYHHSATDYSAGTIGVTWLCIDTPKPQHAHEKPWVKLGFEEEQDRESAHRDDSGICVASWTYPSYDGRDTVILRPSPLLGLKRALEILERDGYSALEGCVGYEIRVEIAKHEPPVCPGCKREMP